MTSMLRRTKGCQRSLISAVACLATLIGALPFVGLAPAGASGAPIALIPVNVQGGQGMPGGADPVVSVRVGRSNPVPVYLDTGSSGLHIFANAVPTDTASGVTITSRQSNITYAGGYRFAGVVASAIITIGPQPTAGPVSFSLVNVASCTPTKPSCAAVGGINGYESSNGVYGILGIGMQSSQGGVVSPILGMPGSLADSWGLRLQGAMGWLVLGEGALLAGHPAPTTFQMKPASAMAGRSLWKDAQIPLCIAVGTTQQCTHGLFDSGTASFQISGPVLGQVHTVSASREIDSGLAVLLTQPGSATPFWSFTTGTAKSEDMVRLGPENGSFINTGVQVFYDFGVLYNEVAGTISLYPAL